MTNIELETLSAIKTAAKAYTANNIDWQQVYIQAAMAAMKGILASNNHFEVFDSNKAESLANASCKYADYLVDKMYNRMDKIKKK